MSGVASRVVCCVYVTCCHALIYYDGVVVCVVMLFVNSITYFTACCTQLLTAVLHTILPLHGSYTVVGTTAGLKLHA